VRRSTCDSRERRAASGRAAIVGRRAGRGELQQLAISTQVNLSLLQLRVLRFGLLQDGNVGVGVFPEREEIVVGAASLGSVTL
jgi:hypothetical protein